MARDYCQSCGIPLFDDNLLGTERDGSPSADYCKYCYRNGHFTNPDWDLDDMRTHITRKMEREGVPEEIIECAVARLENLNRWQLKSTIN